MTEEEPRLLLIVRSLRNQRLKERELSGQCVREPLHSRLNRDSVIGIAIEQPVAETLLIEGEAFGLEESGFGKHLHVAVFEEKREIGVHLLHWVGSRLHLGRRLRQRHLLHKGEIVPERLPLIRRLAALLSIEEKENKPKADGGTLRVILIPERLLGDRVPVNVAVHLDIAAVTCCHK